MRIEQTTRPLPGQTQAAMALARAGRWAQTRGARSGARLLYSAALCLDTAQPIARREVRRLRDRGPGEREGLRFIALGTTGTCNASCLHCPTGKTITAHVPRSTMDMGLFRGVIGEILEQGWSVQSLNFGLFGDGLVDPLVVERARYVREHLPDVMLDVNTNGAAFDAKRHAALNDYISILTLHCESLRPDTYDRLMTPLRAKNVFPKYDRILETFAGKVRISVPVTRINLGQLEEVRESFMARGASEVVFAPLASRCVDDMSLFREVSLAPVEIRCAPDIMNDAIIDCDGQVLACCQDFQRREPIGDVAAAGLAAALQDPRRVAFGRALAESRHEELQTCSRCLGDIRTPEFPFDHPEVFKLGATAAPANEVV